MVQEPWTSFIHNIIVFGESGAGKSSIVNAIVGQPVAKTSNSPIGCTVKNEAYETTIDNTTFHMYDTPGLNENHTGATPHWKAVRGLYTLIRELDGVSLLVFVVQDRLKPETSGSNWILSKVVCGENVPVIAVATGMDHFPDDEEDKFKKRLKDAFLRFGIKPDALGCVVSDPKCGDKYVKSQVRLRELVRQNHLREPWREEKDRWFVTTQYDSLWRRVVSGNRRGHSTRIEGQISKYGVGRDIKDILLEAEKEFRERSLYKISYV